MIWVKILLTLFVIITAFFAVIRSTIKSNEKEIENIKSEKSEKDEDDDDSHTSSYSSRRYYSDPLQKKIEQYEERNESLNSILRFRPWAYAVFALILIVCVAFSSIFFTNEQQTGFTSMFGTNTMIEGPGMHFKVPFISKKVVKDATTQGMPIGYTEGSDENLLEDSLMITADFNFVNIDFYVEYRITDPIEYVYGSDDAKEIFRNIAQASIRNTVGLYDVDSVMTTGKAEIETKVYEDIIKELEKHHTGISVRRVAIQDAEPPTAEVNKAFSDVNNAKSKAESVVNDANAYKNSQIPKAEAEAEQVKQIAVAAKTERVNAAKEEIAKFEALFNEYKNNPDTVKRRLYYEALQEVLPNMQVIVGQDAKVIYVDSSKDSNTVVTTPKVSSSPTTNNESGTSQTDNTENTPAE